MKFKDSKFSSLKKKVFICCSLSMLAAAVLVLAFLLNIDIDRFADKKVSVTFEKRYFLFIILAVIVMFLNIVVTLVYFFRRILSPLNSLDHAARKMADGNLNVKFQSLIPGEFNSITESMNEAVLNIQEVLLHIWNYTSQDLVLIEKIEQSIQSCQSEDEDRILLNERIAALRNDVEDIRNTLQSFDFFDVKIKDKKLVADAPEQELCRLN